MTPPITSTVHLTAGHLNPTTVVDFLIDSTRKQSEVLQYLLKGPQNLLTIPGNDVDVPVLGSGIGANWLASEGAVKPKSDITLSFINIELVEMAVVVPISDRAIQDSIVPMGNLIRTEIARDFARLLDTAIMTNGVAYGWGADFNDSATSAGNTFNGASYADFGLLASAMIGSLEQAGYAYNRKDFAFFFAPNVWQVLRDARTSTGSPLFLMNPVAESGVVGTIYGIPVYEVAGNKFPSGVDLFLVDRSVVHIARNVNGVSIENLGPVAYTNNSGNLVSAAELDQTVFRGTGRYGMNISNDEGVALASGVELAV